MHGYDVAAIYDLSAGNGDLLLMLLIAFVMGAVFGRTLLVQANKVVRAMPALPSPKLLPAANTPDDLKQIPGIGPKVAAALESHGIHSFATLAQHSPEQLHAILHDAGTNATGVRNWPTLAAFLAAQKIHRS